MITTYRHTIIDTSAIIAFFYKEPGWEVAAEYIPNSMLSTVNLAEAIKILITCENLGKNPVIDYIKKAVDQIIPFDEEQANIAGELYLLTKKYGLSLGDRACIATSITTGYPIITADKIWKELKLDNIEIILIR